MHTAASTARGVVPIQIRHHNMDPLTAATTFATVISLIAEFKSQRVASGDDEFEDFQSWLAETRHEELANLLRQNVNTTLSIKALLAVDRRTLEERLEMLDRSLAGIASTLDGFNQLADALRPDAQLSTQALSIIRQFHHAKASRALQLQIISATGPIFHFMDGNQGAIEFSEPQFIEDDLQSLVALGLLRTDYNSSGRLVYVFTRAAAALVSNNA